MNGRRVSEIPYNRIQANFDSPCIDICRDIRDQARETLSLHILRIAFTLICYAFTFYHKPNIINKNVCIVCKVEWLCMSRIVASVCVHVLLFVYVCVYGVLSQLDAHSVAMHKIFVGEFDNCFENANFRVMKVHLLFFRSLKEFNRIKQLDIETHICICSDFFLLLMNTFDLLLPQCVEFYVSTKHQRLKSLLSRSRLLFYTQSINWCFSLVVSFCFL